MAGTVSNHLRERVGQISQAWVARVTRELPSLHALTQREVIDHFPPFIDALAHHVDGEPTGDGFAALVEAHAKQRADKGIDLETVMREYALLRAVILEAEHDEPVRLNAAIDAAVLVVVQRYLADRDVGRISTFAHDLRNPLNTITLSADALKHAQDPIARQAAPAIAESAARMRGVIDAAIEKLKDRSRS